MSNLIASTATPRLVAAREARRALEWQRDLDRELDKADIATGDYKHRPTSSSGR